MDPEREDGRGRRGPEGQRLRPILWIHGDGDLIVSDRSMFDAGTLGSMDALADWPGDEVHPPQPMEAQTRAVLAEYEAAGGSTREEVIVDSSHGRFIDHLDDCGRLIFGFVTAS